jgi:hypothetical protein
MSAQARRIAAGLGSLALVAVGQATAEVIDFNDPTNNKYEAPTFTGAAGVSKMEVTLTDSGAIDDITVVPVPAAAWLFGSALLGAIGIGSRRRAKDKA